MDCNHNQIAGHIQDIFTLYLENMINRRFRIYGQGGLNFFWPPAGGRVFLDAETYKPRAPQPVNSEPSLKNILDVIFN